jgi:hypothetical protein
VAQAIILAIQEAEIRRITVGNWPQQIIRKTLSQKNYHKKGLAEGFKWWSLASVRP